MSREKLAYLEEEIERLKGLIVTDPARVMVGEGMMSVAEAAEFTGLSRAELHNLMADGRLRFLKHGKRRLVPKRAVIDFLAGLAATA